MIISTIKDKALLRPDNSSVRGMIYVPDSHKKRPSVCKVMDYNGRLPIKGKRIIINSLTNERTDPLNEYGDFIISDKHIHGMLHKKKFYPFGSWVLVKRIMGEDYQGSIIIPENRRYQSLDAEVISFGITTYNDSFTLQGINVGDRVRLTQWEPHMIELDLNGYHLLVKEKDLLFKWDK